MARGILTIYGMVEAKCPNGKETVKVMIFVGSEMLRNECAHVLLPKL